MPYLLLRTDKQTKNWLSLDLASVLLLFLDCPCPPAQKHRGLSRAQISVSVANVTWQGTGAGPRSENTLRKRDIWSHLLYSSRQTTAISEVVAGCAWQKEMLFLNCLSHPWNCNLRGSGAASYWKKVSELTGEELLEFSFAELRFVSFFARVVMENPDQGVHCILQCCGHSSEWESCGAKTRVSDVAQEPVLGLVLGKGLKDSWREKLLPVSKKWIFSQSMLLAECEQH